MKILRKVFRVVINKHVKLLTILDNFKYTESINFCPNCKNSGKFEYVENRVTELFTEDLIRTSPFDDYWDMETIYQDYGDSEILEKIKYKCIECEATFDTLPKASIFDG